MCVTLRSSRICCSTILKSHICIAVPLPTYSRSQARADPRLTRQPNWRKHKELLKPAARASRASVTQAYT